MSITPEIKHCTLCGNILQIRHKDIIVDGIRGDYFRCSGCGQQGNKESFEHWRKKLKKEGIVAEPKNEYGEPIVSRN